MKKTLLLLIMPVAAWIGPIQGAIAQSYPQRPITLVVVKLPGGIVDATSRVWALYASNALGQPVVVEVRLELLPVHPMPWKGAPTSHTGREC